MDFEFSDEQEQLRASLRRFLAERAPIGWVRERWADGHSITPDVWQELAALGACGVCVPEAHGGAGLSMVDAAVVLEELGRAVNPAPYAETAVAAVALVTAAGSAAVQAELLPKLAAGDVIMTLALLEPGRRAEWRTPATRLTFAGDTRPHLTGTKSHVACAADAHYLLVSSATEHGLRVAVVPTAADGVEIVPEPVVDGGHPSATVGFHDVTDVRLLGDDPEQPDDPERPDDTGPLAAAIDRLGVAQCLDAVGAASRALELAVEYGHQRHAFGRPIGSFQAVQHLCADMLRAVELGRAASYYAAWALDGADPAEAHRAATLALAHCTAALPVVGASAIQVFAGIGFTWEHDIQLFYKRLVHLGAALGTADDHIDELARLAID